MHIRNVETPGAAGRAKPFPWSADGGAAGEDLSSGYLGQSFETAVGGGRVVEPNSIRPGRALLGSTSGDRGRESAMTFPLPPNRTGDLPHPALQSVVLPPRGLRGGGMSCNPGEHPRSAK